jgi:DnaK suppressor protein
MTDTELEKFRATLLEQRQDLMRLGDSAKDSVDTVELDQSSVGRLSRMDALQSQAMAQENKRRREVQLVRIQAALERLETGDYGYCASCGEEISPRRLEVDPANPFCIACASKM